MKLNLPSNFVAHIVAIIGAIVLHIAIVGWVMLSDPPVVVDQSQIIQVSMVAPTMIKQEKVKPEQNKRVQDKIPPAPKGMVKQKSETLKKEQKKEPEKNTQIQQITSGISQKNAIETSSAITKPIAASYLNNPPPHYPEKSRLRNQEGTVLLDVRVKIDGKPENVSILRSSGYTLLDRAALDAVRRWVFVPARRGSENIEANVEVPVQFQIK